MVTMDEIAEKAGVSQSTVSRVLNGNPKVNPEAKKKVLEWIRKLNYQPNATAQSLVRRQSFLLGVVIPDISNPFFAELLRIVEKNSIENGYNIIFCNTNGNILKEKNDLIALRSRQVDGILMVPSDSNAKHLKDLKDSQIPVMMVTQNVKGFDSVSVSHFSGGEQVAKHLINMGCKVFGFIGGKGDEKFLGFQKVLSKYGIEVLEENYIECLNWNQIISHELNSILQQKIEQKTFKMDAIFAYNDLAAFETMILLLDKGYKLPEDVALVGFDNTFIASEVKPGLTTVSQPLEEIGRIAVEMLINKINTQKNKVVIENEEEQHIVVEPRLIVRDSTNRIF